MALGIHRITPTYKKKRETYARLCRLAVLIAELHAARYVLPLAARNVVAERRL